MKEEKKYHLFRVKLGTLNFVSILLLIIMILLTFFLTNIIDINISFELNNRSLGILLITYILYISLHEIIHSISYVIHGADFSKITYGAHIEKGILCCLCKQNISRKNILNSLLYPLFYIGIITYIFGFIIKSPLLITLSVLNISGCAGDIIMFIYFIRLKNFEYTEYDDPISFAIFTKEDLSTHKPFGLKYLEAKEDIKRKDLKKLSISKPSFIIFPFLIMCSMILIFL